MIMSSQGWYSREVCLNSSCVEKFCSIVWSSSHWLDVLFFAMACWVRIFLLATKSFFFSFCRVIGGSCLLPNQHFHWESIRLHRYQQYTWYLMVVVSKHLAFSSFSILHLLLPQVPPVNNLSVSTITKGRAYQEIIAYWNLLRPVWYLMSSFLVISFRWRRDILWTLLKITRNFLSLLELFWISALLTVTTQNAIPISSSILQ